MTIIFNSAQCHLFSVELWRLFKCLNARSLTFKAGDKGWRLYKFMRDIPLIPKYVCNISKIEKKKKSELEMKKIKIKIKNR